MIRIALLLTAIVLMLSVPPMAHAAMEWEGDWLAEDIRGGGVIDRVQTMIRVDPDGRISGTGGCNRMMGQATFDGDAMSLGPVASTRMACAPAVMDQEQKFFDALSAVKFWRVDAMKKKLFLLDAQRRTLITFSRT